MGGMRSRSYTSLEIVKSSSSSTLLFAKSDTNGHPSSTSGVVSEERIETERADSEGGCPIHIQTAENIKMVAQVPNAQATVYLAGVVRFVEAHFQDLRAMKTHLEKMLGGEFLDEQMEILKLIFEKSSKYMLSPDLDIAVNINGKLINIGGDSLCLRVETPDEVRVDTTTDERHHDLVPPNAGSKPNLTNKDSTVEHPNRRRPNTSTSNTTQHPDLRRSSGVDNVNSSSINSSAVAVALRADVYIQDIFDDSKAFDAFIKSIHTSAQTSSETNNNHSNNNTNNSSYNST